MDAELSDGESRRPSEFPKSPGIQREPSRGARVLRGDPRYREDLTYAKLARGWQRGDLPGYFSPNLRDSDAAVAVAVTPALPPCRVLRLIFFFALDLMT